MSLLSRNRMPTRSTNKRDNARRHLCTATKGKRSIFCLTEMLLNNADSGSDGEEEKGHPPTFHTGPRRAGLAEGQLSRETLEMVKASFCNIGNLGTSSRCAHVFEVIQTLLCKITC